MHKDWALEVRDLCSDSGAAFFFKQWGGARPKSGGRLLEGEEWNGFPYEVVPVSIGRSLHAYTWDPNADLTDYRGVENT